MLDAPFIQLFRTPNSGYFFDANMDELIPVSMSSLQYLKAVCTGSAEAGGDMPQELLALKEQGYLAQKSAVENVRHIYSDFLPVFLDRKIAKLTLQLTQSCNFRCKYCIYSEDIHAGQRSHSGEKMRWETAKKAVDFFREHSVDSPHVNIGFYGGEPLLEFPLLKRVVSYARERFSGKRLTFNITTNGTLLTDEIIEYFAAHDISMMISLDGPKEINDLNRVFAGGGGTFDAVTERIERVKQIAPEYAKKLQISMVIDPQNDFDCFDSICLDGEALSKLAFQPSLVDHGYDGEATVASEEYVWKYEYQRFLALLSHFGRFPKEAVSPIASGVLAAAVNDYQIIASGAKLNAADAPSGPCIPGQMRLFVNVHEQMFPCERVSETCPAICIGTLDEGFTLENADAVLNVGRLTEEACKKCWCFRHCGLCVKKADGGEGALSAKAKLSYCREAQANAYAKLFQYLLLKEAPLYYPKQIRKSADYEKEGACI